MRENETFFGGIRKNKIVSSPLDKIKDGHEFQQIIAEYFRSLKNDDHEFNFTDINVLDFGVGCDDGCDILVEFFFEDAICKHSQKWIVECKSHKKAIGPDLVNTNKIFSTIDAKGASGYLLVCKNDATASLKRKLNECSVESKKKFIIWNGSQLWHKFIKRKSLIQAFFLEYYQEKFQDNNAEKKYNELVKKFENKISEEGKK